MSNKGKNRNAKLTQSKKSYNRKKIKKEGY